MTGPRVIDAASLLEREHELGALDGAVAAAAGGAGEIVLVHGPAGAGKTRLVAHARAAARRQGLFVLEARGAQLEEGFAFGVARRLLEPVAATSREEHEELFAGAAAMAQRLFDPEAPGDGGADASFATLHGLYWLVVNLADRARCSSPSTTLTGPTRNRCASWTTSRTVSTGFPSRCSWPGVPPRAPRRLRGRRGSGVGWRRGPPRSPRAAAAQRARGGGAGPCAPVSTTTCRAAWCGSSGSPTSAAGSRPTTTATSRTRTNQIDIVLAGDERAVRRITDGGDPRRRALRPVLQPRRAGHRSYAQRALHGTQPHQAQPVRDALRDPRNFTYVRPR